MIVELKKRFRIVGFRFDAMAALLMCQQHKAELDELDKIPKDDYLPSWIWSAHRSYCMLNYKKPGYTYEQMKKFIDAMRKSEWDKLLKAMNSVKAPADGKKKV